MKPEIIAKLLSINHQFYQEFAAEFSETRGRIQPGAARLLARVPPDARALDLGCGNGSAARALAAQGFHGRYVGVDSSGQYSVGSGQYSVGSGQYSVFSDQYSVFSDQYSVDRGKEAENREWRMENCEFRVGDLASGDWDAGLEGPFDCAFAFAVLHHLPGQALREQVCRKIRGLLATRAENRESKIENRKSAIRHPPSAIPNLQLPTFLLSNWQPLHSPRWRARIQPWETVGLTAADVDPGDYLLDWRRGGLGYRYVHHFTEAELAALAAATGFRVAETFYSDGKEGNLGMYQVWEER